MVSDYVDINSVPYLFAHFVANEGGEIKGESFQLVAGECLIKWPCSVS